MISACSMALRKYCESMERESDAQRCSKTFSQFWANYGSTECFGDMTCGGSLPACYVSVAYRWGYEVLVYPPKNVLNACIMHTFRLIVCCSNFLI